MRIREILRVLDDVENRRKGFRIWLLLVLAWSITRTFIVGTFFHKHGLNTWYYFLIDFLSSFPYAFASAYAVLATYEKRFKAAYFWIAITTISFYVPDIFIIRTTHHVPLTIYLGFAIALVFLSTLAFLQLMRNRKSL